MSISQNNNNQSFNLSSYNLNLEPNDYLKNAREIFKDFILNDKNLCEKNFNSNIKFNNLNQNINENNNNNNNNNNNKYIIQKINNIELAKINQNSNTRNFIKNLNILKSKTKSISKTLSSREALISDSSEDKTRLEIKKLLNINSVIKENENEKEYNLLMKKYYNFLIVFDKIINIYKNKENEKIFNKIKKYNINFFYIFNQWILNIKKIILKSFKECINIYNENIKKKKINGNIINDDSFLNNISKSEDDIDDNNNMLDYEEGLLKLKEITKETKGIEEAMNTFALTLKQNE